MYPLFKGLQSTSGRNLTQIQVWRTFQGREFRHRTGKSSYGLDLRVDGVARLGSTALAKCPRSENLTLLRSEPEGRAVAPGSSPAAPATSIWPMWSKNNHTGG